MKKILIAFLFSYLPILSFGQNVNSKDAVLTGWYYIVDTSGYKMKLDKTDEYYYINPVPIVSVKNILTMNIYHTIDSSYGLSMQLDYDGTKKWNIATKKSIDNRLAFVIDNKLLEVAYVNSEIQLGMTALNRFGYSQAELEKFRGILKNEK